MALTIKVSPFRTSQVTEDTPPAIEQLSDNWFSGKYYWGATLGTSNDRAAAAQIEITADEDTILTALSLKYHGTSCTMSSVKGDGTDLGSSWDDRLSMYIFKLEDLENLNGASKLKRRVPRGSSNGVPSAEALKLCLGALEKKVFSSHLKIDIKPQLIRKGETLKLHVHIQRVARHWDWMAMSGLGVQIAKTTHFISHESPGVKVNLEASNKSVNNYKNLLTITENDIQPELTSLKKVKIRFYSADSLTRPETLGTPFKEMETALPAGESWEYSFTNGELLSDGLKTNYWYATVSVIDNFDYEGPPIYTNVIQVNKIPQKPTITINHDKGIIEEIQKGSKYKVYLPSTSFNNGYNRLGLISIYSGEDSDKDSPVYPIVRTVNSEKKPANATSDNGRANGFQPQYSTVGLFRYWTWDGFDASEDYLLVETVKNIQPVLRSDKVVFSTEDSEGIPNGQFKLSVANSPFEQTRKTRNLRYRLETSDDNEQYFEKETVKSTELTYEQANAGMIPEITVNLVEIGREKVTPGQYYRVYVSAFDGVEWSEYILAHDENAFQTVGKLEYEDGQNKTVILSHSDILPDESNSLYVQYYKKRTINCSFFAPPCPTAVPPERYRYRVFCNYYDNNNNTISSKLALQEENSNETNWAVGDNEVITRTFFAPPLENKNEHSMNVTVEFYTLNTAGKEIQKIPSIGTVVKISGIDTSDRLLHAWQLEFPKSDSYSLTYTEIDKLRIAAFRPNYFYLEDNKKIYSSGINITGAIPDSSLSSINDYELDFYFSLKYQGTTLDTEKTAKVNGANFELEWAQAELSYLNYNLIHSLTADLPVILEVRDLFGNIATKDYVLKIDFRERPKQLTPTEDGDKIIHPFKLGATGLSIFDGSLPPKRYEVDEKNETIKSAAYYKPSDFFPNDVKMMSHEALLVKFDYNKIKSYPEQVCSKARVQVCQNITSPIPNSPTVLKDWQEISTLVVGGLYDVKNETAIEEDGKSVTTDYRVLEIPLYNIVNSNTAVNCYLNIEFIDDSLYNSYRSNVGDKIGSVAYSDTTNTKTFLYLERPKPRINLDKNQLETELSFSFNNKILTLQEGQSDSPVDFIVFSKEEFSETSTEYFKRNIQYYIGRESEGEKNIILADYSPQCEYYCDLSIYPNFNEYDEKLITGYNSTNGNNWKEIIFPKEFKIDLTSPSSLYYFLRGRVIYTEGISWDGTSFQPIIKILYTDTHTYSDNIPTVSYRQNAVGINTEPASNNLFEVKMKNEARSNILFSGTYVKKATDEEGGDITYHPSIQFDFINQKITYKDTEYEDKGISCPLQLTTYLIPKEWIATTKDVKDMFNVLIDKNLTSS